MTAHADWTATDFLAFGIPSLDRMFGPIDPDPKPGNNDPRADLRGYPLRPAWENEHPEGTTVCVIGPDGTGKSLLALHLVSDYARRTADQERPRIIYASTDLSVERARAIWKSFWLDVPHYRRTLLPFDPDRPTEPLAPEAEAKRVNLHPYRPMEQGEAFTRALTGEDAEGDVIFVDLEATTSGDDWGFLHNLLAVLPEPEKTAPRHLLVVDAVEGLETLVGERDAFGEPQTRRARIAQLVRAAASKAHLVFIAEEQKDGERLPDVFVADVVVRLRSEVDRDYARRSVEFEKVRGQAHTRGQHDFRIRQGGSRTGVVYNPDDPQVPPEGKPSVDGRQRMSYVQVFPSLHEHSRELQAPAGPAAESPPEQWRYASLGVYQIDAMLGRATTVWDLTRGRVATGGAGVDEMGLPIGTVTTLVGNESTYKSQLGRAFLSQAFRTRHVDRGIPEHVEIKKANEVDPLGGQGVAVLLTTNDNDADRLAGQLKHHLIATPPDSPLDDKEMTQARGLKERVIVRRLEPHHLPAAILVHIVRSLVEAAQDLLLAPFRARNPDLDVEEKWVLSYGVVADTPEAAVERRKLETKYPHRLPVGRRALSGRIRLVIDDWATILSTHPEVARDPLLVPYLLHYLRRQGVTTLIQRTRSGNPNDGATEDLDREVQAVRPLADHHLFTWHVPFYGERRVALTAIPGLRFGEDNPVRELRPGRVSELPPKRISEVEADRRREEEAKARGARAEPKSARDRADQDQGFDPEALVVDPHFELYADLEAGRPKPVLLQVRLYAESEDVPASRTYLAEVEHLFRQMFGQEERVTVVRPEYGSSYDLLRELSYLRSEAKLDHTLVLQVDEFWAESRSELQRQEGYMNARTVDRNGTAIRAEDPFQLFQLTDATVACLRERRNLRVVREALREPLRELWRVRAEERFNSEKHPNHPAKAAEGLPPDEPERLDWIARRVASSLLLRPAEEVEAGVQAHVKWVAEKRVAKERVDPYGPDAVPPTKPDQIPMRLNEDLNVYRYEFFDLIGYGKAPVGVHPYKETEKEFPIYKVPFTWDFGFLVCDREAWERAADARDHRTRRVTWEPVDADGKEWEQADPKKSRFRAVVEMESVRHTWLRLWKIGVPTIDPHAIRELGSVSTAEPVRFITATPSRIGQVPGEQGEVVAYVETPPPAPSAHWTEFQNLTRNETGPDGKRVQKKAFAVFHRTGDAPAGKNIAGGHDPQHQDGPVSWREFLGACRTVARTTREGAIPFDLDLMAVETFSCLVFEVWMSEIHQACATACATQSMPRLRGEEADEEEKRQLVHRLAELLHPLGRCANPAAGPTDEGDTRWRPRTLRGQQSGHSLTDLLGRVGEDGELVPEAAAYRRALYRTFLLLDEAFAPGQLPEDNLVLQPRAASPRAVASRHWYSTASAALTAADRRGRFTVVGLPGNFTTRGDWFLAVARGSRSHRLGERAIDILSSRRGNISRLQAGIGLPVRTVVGPGGVGQKRLEYRTSLPVVRDMGREEWIPYTELRKLGAHDDGDRLGRKNNFFWFWRSTIQSYDVHARIWQKWLRDVLKQWAGWEKPRAPAVDSKLFPVNSPDNLAVTQDQPWWDGFVEYDYYRCKDIAAPEGKLCYVVETSERWGRFQEYCDGLVSALRRAGHSDIQPSAEPPRGGEAPTGVGDA